VHPSLLPHTRHLPHPSHSSRFHDETSSRFSKILRKRLKNVSLY
jgi:hypothetical protein